MRWPFRYGAVVNCAEPRNRGSASSEQRIRAAPLRSQRSSLGRPQLVAAATALNDWLEGARRLNGDDIANWRLPPDEPSAATRAPPPRWAVGGEEEEEEEIRMV